MSLFSNKSKTLSRVLGATILLVGSAIAALGILGAVEERRWRKEIESLPEWERTLVLNVQKDMENGVVSVEEVKSSARFFREAESYLEEANAEIKVRNLRRALDLIISAKGAMEKANPRVLEASGLVKQIKSAERILGNMLAEGAIR